MLFEILNRAGAHLCYQTAPCADSALSFARMYGVRGAVLARLAQGAQR